MDTINIIKDSKRQDCLTKQNCNKRPLNVFYRTAVHLTKYFNY